MFKQIEPFEPNELRIRDMQIPPRPSQIAQSSSTPNRSRWSICVIFFVLGEHKMLRLITILSFAFLWSTVNGVARCPFPGRTNGASFTDNSINWQNLPSFGEGETVQYECNGDWRTLEGVDYSLTCQRNGLWNGPLPVCGNFHFPN